MQPTVSNIIENKIEKQQWVGGKLAITAYLDRNSTLLSFSAENVNEGIIKCSFALLLPYY
jgi:hypothetical protein